MHRRPSLYVPFTLLLAITACPANMSCLRKRDFALGEIFFELLPFVH